MSEHDQSLAGIDKISRMVAELDIDAKSGIRASRLSWRYGVPG